MRLLLAQNTTYFPSHGGASKGNRLLLERLAARGHACFAVVPATGVQSGIVGRGDFLREMAARGIAVRPSPLGVDVWAYERDGVEVHAALDPARVPSLLLEAARRLHPDRLLASSEDTAQVLLEAALEALPSGVVYLARTTWNLPFGPVSFVPSAAKTGLLRRALGIASISDYVAGYIRRWGGMESTVLRLPVMTLGTAPCPRQGGFDAGFVTTMNPCAVKGIDIFLELARRRPGVAFAAVPTWGTTAGDRAALESLPNVTLWPAVDDVDQVYARTRVLLMPSLWGEAYGRSAVEAMVRGIPVLASDVGGLPEAKLGVPYVLPVAPIEGYRQAMDDRNLPVPEVPPQPIAPWLEALTTLLGDRDRYTALAEQSRAAALSLLASVDVADFDAWLAGLSPRRELGRSDAPEGAEPGRTGPPEGGPAGDPLESLTDEQRALLALKARQLRRQRQATAATPAAAPAIPVAPRDRPLPLSFAQERAWFFEQWEPGTAALNIPLTVEALGDLRLPVLQAAMDEITRRHESLRTSFIAAGDSRPVQVIAPPGPLPLPLVDLTGLPAPRRREEADRLALAEARRPFDLTRGPLLRASVLRLDGGEHLVLFTMHHIVSDGWSMAVLIREVRTLYQVFAEGRRSPLPEPRLQYADFAVWQRERLQGETLAAHLDWWRRQLDGASPLTELPSDRRRGAVQSVRGVKMPVHLPGGLPARLKALADSEGATLFMVLATAFQILLWRYTGQPDLVLGTLMANRNRRELEDLIGFFVNTLLLRTRVAEGQTAREVLGGVRTAVLGAHEHQDLPFSKLVEELNRERIQGRNPLFQILFAVQNTPLRRLELPGLELRLREFERGAVNYDLFFSLGEDGHGFMEHSTDLFEAATMERLFGHYCALLAGIADDPGRPVGELPLLGAAEQRQLLEEWSGSRQPASAPSTLTALLGERARRTPDALAVLAAGERLTYRELHERAGRWAGRLRRLGVGPEVPVGLCAGRSPEMIAAMLGILAAGGAYVPVDPATPPERAAALLADAGVPVVLTDEILADVLRVPGARVLPLQAAAPATAEEAAVSAAEPVPSSLAYVIYTSGSTGEAKGVMVHHGAVANYVRQAAALYSIGPGDRVLQFCSIGFDASVEEIFTTLTAGGALALRDDSLLDPAALLRRCREWELSVLSLPTAFWHELVASAEAEGLEMPPTLRLVILGGERPLPERLAAWQARFGARPALVNTYGPTETTVICTAASPESTLAGSPDGEAPMGRPLGGLRVHVLDAAGRPVPAGVTGELHAGGAGIARGYLGRPGLTAERFVPDPFAAELAGEAGARLYRTGDLVRFLASGELEFQGRLDHQVKIRGFRVEPGEVEAALRRHSEVRDAVVQALPDGRGGYRLAAWVVAPPGLTAAGLRAYLAPLLPQHMIPAAFVVMEALPLTTTGKTDLRALPEPREEPAGAAVARELPRTPMEELVAGLWCEVLGLDGADGVDVHADFFEAGGHSLVATQLVSRLRGALGIELALRDLFESPTVEGMARKVEALQRSGIAGNVPPITPAPPADAYELSFSQERLWFLDQLQPGDPAYNLPAPVWITGRLDVPALARTFAEIVRRHEALRTTFAEVQGRPRQVVHPPAPSTPLPWVDLGGLAGEPAEAEARRLARAEARRPFDLGRGPLLRVTLLRLEGERSALLLTLHHIVSDGWSMGVLLQEVAALYDAFSRGLPPPLPEPAVQYRDFAAWQRELLRDDRLAEQLGYWRRRLAAAPPALELPGRRSRTGAAMDGARGGSRRLRLAQPLVGELRALGRRQGATLFMTLLGLFSALLQRYSGETDILLGVPVAHRTRPELEGLIGFFVNTLVMRTDLSGRPGARQLLERVRETTLEAYAHQDMPFERLVAELNPGRDLSRSPLFQVMFALQNAPAVRIRLPEVTLSSFDFDSGTARFEMFLEVMERPDELDAILHYSADLFDEPLMARMLRHLEALLRQAVARPGEPLAALPLLDGAEVHQLLVEWNDAAALYPREAGLAELFERQVARMPGAVAASCGGEEWTYAELDRRAGGLAHRLIREGVEADEVVGLLADRGLRFLGAVLGTYKAGGAYLPLDPRHPAARVRRVLEQSRCRLVLVEARYRGLLEEALAGMAAPPMVLELDELPDLPLAERPAGLPARSGPRHLAYVLFTSGSTGMPKGAMIEQRGAVNHLWAKIGALSLTASDVVAQTASQCFDISFWQFLAALMVGGRVAIFDDEEAHDPARLLGLVARRRVTVLETVPSLLRAVLEEGARGQRTGLPDLRWMIPTGEALPPALARDWQRAYPQARLLNAYGPTECSDDVSHHLVEAVAGDQVSISIGRPVINTRLHVLDAGLLPVPLGVAGELCVGGDGVGRGYLHEPARTAQAFVPDPFSAEPGGRLYRTGDLARHLPDGSLDFLGRIDHQVKVRGLRIELGEIEAVLGAVPEVREVVVLARDDSLIAYLVGRDGAPLEVEALRGRLRRTLPEYMVPAHFVVLDEMPRGATGKIDRRALPAVDGAGLFRATEYVAPESEVEETVAAIFAALVGVERVGLYDSFFEIGGHSLLATQAVSRIREAFGIGLPLRALFEGPTVAEVAALVEDRLMDELEDLSEEEVDSLLLQ